jgi:hypothetical protein
VHKKTLCYFKETSRLTLFRQMTAVYSENHSTHINEFLDEPEIFNIKASVLEIDTARKMFR